MTTRTHRATPRIDVEAVRDGLRVETVVDAYGLQPRASGAQLRLAECPRCHERTQRRGVSIDASSGVWLHHGHEREAGGSCSGDLIDLVAALEGLDTRSDWQRVIARCAELAGVDAAPVDPVASARAKAARERAAQERRRVIEAEDRARRDRALAIAPAHWRGLRRRHDKGEAFLRGRGLDVAALLARDLMRFEPSGDVAVPIFTADGRVISVARRVLQPAAGAPKVLTLPGCPATGSLVGALPSIVHGRDVVLVEGITDALTACLAWPSAVVLGANGAGRLPRIAGAAAARVKLAGVRLLLVPDDDETGARAMVEAGKAAIGSGLAFGRTLRVIDVGAKDLNDAWATGWRPRGGDR